MQGLSVAGRVRQRSRRRRRQRPPAGGQALVERLEARSRGIGSLLLREYVRGLDADRLPGYLETDKPDNVVFCAKHGFEVTGEAAVLGRPNWFMQRRP